MSDQLKATVHPPKGSIRTTVEYLPAAHPYRHEYPGTTQLTNVRLDAMGFFGVSDHRDRDVHEFFLTFHGSRITDLSQTIAHLIGHEDHNAHFDLVEQITPGGE